MMLMMHYSASIASLASPDPMFTTAFLTLALERSWALSPTKLRVHPLKMCLLAPSPHPHTPLSHFVRSKSSSLAYRLAFVIYIYIYIYMYLCIWRFNTFQMPVASIPFQPIASIPVQPIPTASLAAPLHVLRRNGQLIFSWNQSSPVSTCLQ